MARSPQYVELHASSAFSFLDGASQPEALVERCVELQLPSMALLDRNGVYGAPRFHLAAKKHSLEAHIGAEISIDPRSNNKLSLCFPRVTKHLDIRISLLCESRIGYQNLCQLITSYKLRALGKSEGFALLNELEKYSAGLVCITGGEEGALASALSIGGEEAGRRLVEIIINIYGKRNVYIELQRHQLREQEWRNQACLRIATSLNLPILATNGVRYATAQDREVLDILTTVRNKTTISNAGRLLEPNANRYIRNERDMSYLFSDLPKAIQNSVELSSRLDFRLSDLGYRFPAFEKPQYTSMDDHLHHNVQLGIRKRYGVSNKKTIMAQALAQAQNELQLISSLGFAGYFLIVQDIVNYCQHHGILIQGRGSAANSVVCYALEITAVDPISMNLLFERFLNENRGEWPDIDLDLPSGDEREKVIQYVYGKYGETGSAMTANVITYRGRSAAREVGKSLGFDEETVGKLNNLVGHWEWKGPADTLTHNFQQAGLDLHHPRVAKYLDLTLRMQDLPRHLGQHSGGMVICQGLLSKIVPIERASMAGRTVVQWDKNDCADLGLVKVDLLGLGMMAVLKDCMELIPNHYGVTEDLAQLPQDKRVYETLCKGDTVGMFQVESRAQMASLPRNAPEQFYDIVVQVAIIRPGPIVGKMMHPYMRRRQGKEEVTFPHPSLIPVLQRTLGVPLFQEQLLRIAMIAANFTGAEAEELRRAVGMRRSMARMQQLEGKLRDGMTANSIDKETQELIVQSISSFALYGFPESHAASFALLVYASAYFKVNYLAAFTCAIMNNQPMGFYMPAVLVKDAQRHGLRVRPICIQRSIYKCNIESGTDKALSVRIGFNYVRGLHKGVAEEIVASRIKLGLFQDIEDLLHRVPALTRADRMQLARIGALNSLSPGSHRRDALWQVEKAGRPVGPLLDNNGVQTITDCPASPLRQMSTEERLVSDYAGTGITPGHHPMYYKRTDLRAEGVFAANELRALHDGQYVRTAGCVIARQRPGTASGFIFLSLEDETGIANIIIHPELYERQRLLVTQGKFLLVQGTLQNQDEVVHVKADLLSVLAISNVEVRSHDFH